jgi:curved DNA-binding protein CbpA
MSKSSWSKRRITTKDFYRILQVSKDATTEEIKKSYRKLALTLHPDRNNGDADKTIAFKEASEAYDVLISPDRRRQYDVAHGFGTPSGWYNKNRKRPPPANYRTVYAPHAPPSGKWHDAHRHYQMHYGDGMFQEALKGAYERARSAGELDYHSPLGKGFTFEKTFHTSAANPYSKASQGPPTQEYQYEEGYVDEHQTILKRKRGVVSKLHERREERYKRQEEAEKERRQSFSSSSAAIIPGQKVYKPFNASSTATESDGAGCIVM